MAMKTPTTTTETTQAPAPEAPAAELATVGGGALAAFSGIKLFDIPAPQSTADLFPAVKIPYAIEMGDKFKATDIFQVGLFDGTAFTKLSCPCTLSVIAAREATRKLTVNEKGEKNYERAYKPMGAGFDASGPLFEAHLQDPTAERGVSYVVAIVQGENVALAEIPAFKVMKDFWGLPLHQALVSNGMGVTLRTGDVSSCQVASKKDPTRKYLDPKRFNSPAFTVVGPVPVETLKLIAAALETAKDKFTAWAKR